MPSNYSTTMVPPWDQDGTSVPTVDIRALPFHRWRLRNKWRVSLMDALGAPLRSDHATSFQEALTMARAWAIEERVQNVLGPNFDVSTIHPSQVINPTQAGSLERSNTMEASCACAGNQRKGPAQQRLT